MRQPEEVRDILRARFDRDYPDWARGYGTWPLRINLRPPARDQRSTDPVGCHTWAAAWARYPGPGTIEHTSVRFPTGTHQMPKTLVLPRASDIAAAHPATQQIWKRCGQRLIALQNAFPDAQFTGIIRKITNLDQDDYQRLLDTTTWLHANPTSGLLVRQLPIEGIDTKWLQRHASLVLAMLGHSDQPSADLDHEDKQNDDTATRSARRRLHARLGLRLPPELVQVTVLDPHLRAGVGGMRHFAASVDDLNTWPKHPTKVIILENKETGYALTDDIPHTVALHGSGFNVANYARITWIRNAATVLYWGDIDAPGLQFVNDLRSYGVPARTVLMDTATLTKYRHLTTNGAAPQRNALPHLTHTEQKLYSELTAHAARHEAGLLLEQERIPWPHAHRVLITELRVSTSNPTQVPNM